MFIYETLQGLQHTEWEKLGNFIRTLRYSGARTVDWDAVLASTLKELIGSGIVSRRSYDEIPPRVEYTLTERGMTVVPILQSICQWAGVIYKEDTENTMTHCQKCDYR